MGYAPQGTFSFPGIDAVLSGNFSLTPGISPSVCMLSVAPQPLWSPKVGPLAIDYSSVHLRFRDCTIDRIESRTGNDGLTTWTITILDRRWKWRGLGRISGYYNVRRETTGERPDEIVEGTEKTPRELAKLCLDALEEKGYDLSGLPDKPRPSIEWDYTTPAEALAKLCDSLDCLVVLTAADRVLIARKNVGAVLPFTPTVLAGGSEVDPPERPDAIVIVTAPARVQQDLLMEAIGDDVDYDVNPIDELDYTPDGGWFEGDNPDEFLGVEDPGHRRLAAGSVFRKYRIAVPFTTVDDEVIDNLDRILPLLSEQVRSRSVMGREEPKPIEVYGQFEEPETSSLGDKAVEDETLPEGVLEPNMPYMESFSVDSKTGIVTFNRPVFRFVPGPDGLPQRMASALLYLRVAFNVRAPDTRGWVRGEYKSKTEGPKSGTLPAYFRHDDLVPKFWKIDAAGFHDNRPLIRRQAEYYRDSHLLNYVTTRPQTYEYGGFVKLSPDGAVSTVTWTLSGEGYATTRALRGKDDLLVTPTYAERRLWERLAEENRQRAQTESEQAQRQARGRA